MRHIAKLLVFLCLLVSAPVAVVPFQQPAPQKQIQNKAETVYVTRTGKKYHRENCRFPAYEPVSAKEGKTAQRG